jgi:DNA-binding transcriptional LysR family regulator
MQAGEVDLSVMGRAPKEIHTRSESFAAHPLVFVAPPGHPLLRGGPHAVNALAPYPIIAREHGSGTRAAMQKFFDERRFEPRLAMEMSSNETIKQAVMAGLGLSFLSLHTMGLELRSGLLALLDIRDAPVMRMWNVVHLSSKLLSPAAEAFRYFMLEQAEAHLLAHDAPLLGR